MSIVSSSPMRVGSGQELAGWEISFSLPSRQWIQGPRY